jgi:SAM-dependent methyltransferase
MKQDDRAPFVQALRRARSSAYAPGEFVEQESFMRASEIRALAGRAGIAAGVSVLDLCCGVAGPGRFLTQELDCAYLGVDASASAVAIARERAGDLPCRFTVAQVPPLPAGRFDVVLLLETMLAFEDKDALVREIAAVLRPGGRFAFTLEEGPPLTAAERAAMPDSDTVWLTPLDEIATSLERAGLVVTWQEDHSRAHRAAAQALAAAFAADAEDIAAQIGRRALAELLAAHRLWIEWLDEGRVRKLALVASMARPGFEPERAGTAERIPGANPDESRMARPGFEPERAGTAERIPGSNPEYCLRRGAAVSTCAPAARPRAASGRRPPTRSLIAQGGASTSRPDATHSKKIRTTPGRRAGGASAGGWCRR